MRDIITTLFGKMAGCYSYIYMYAIGASAVEIDARDGDPECVMCCDVEAIKYVPKDLMDISLKRSKSDKVMELFALMRQSR